MSYSMGPCWLGHAPSIVAHRRHYFTLVISTHCIFGMEVFEQVDCCYVINNNKRMVQPQIRDNQPAFILSFILSYK